MMSTQENLPPQQRILLATIQCIERHGLSGTTVRRITELAGVNVAAINYYFGSKDRLLEAALAATLEEGFPKALTELKELLAEAGAGGVREAVEAFLRDYLTHALDYPRISVAHLGNALLRQDYASQAPVAIRAFADGFLDVLSPHLPQPTAVDRRRAVVHVWATIIQLALLPDLFGVPRDELRGEGMARMLTATLLGPEPSTPPAKAFPWP